MGHEEYILEAERMLCENIQKNKNDPNFSASIEIPDDPDLTVFERNEAVLSQEPEKTVKKKLVFVEDAVENRGQSGECENELSHIDPDELNRLLNTSMQQDVEEAAELDLNFSNIRPAEVYRNVFL